MFTLGAIGFNFVCRRLTRFFCTMMVEEESLLSTCRSIIPVLDNNLHKGQCGRIAVIGGSQEYTGAPYFAAISALKVGADLSHVFCPPDAAPVIKSYSPELIVHPILLADEPVAELSEWLDRMHGVVLGPGLGIRAEFGAMVREIIEEIRTRKLPLVIDADGLHYVTERPDLVRDYAPAILTPNVVEFGRLYRTLFDTDASGPDLKSGEAAKRLSQKLGFVTIMQKGEHDIITNGDKVIKCTRPGSPRRCGGQGDLLSGSMGTFAFWAQQTNNISHTRTFEEYGSPMVAAYCGSVLTRECSRLAYDKCKRTMTTGDLIEQIQNAFDILFPAS